MAQSAEVPTELVTRVRSICLELPEAYEEQAWVGTRWLVRKKTFAHVLTVVDGYPPAYARAVGDVGPAHLLTFRSPLPELDSLVNSGHPFFKPVWFPDIVGMVLGDTIDWDEVRELLTESYRVLAPQRLAKLID